MTQSGHLVALSGMLLSAWLTLLSVQRRQFISLFGGIAPPG